MPHNLVSLTSGLGLPSSFAGSASLSASVLRGCPASIVAHAMCMRRIRCCSASSRGSNSIATGAYSSAAFRVSGGVEVGNDKAGASPAAIGFNAGRKGRQFRATPFVVPSSASGRRAHMATPLLCGSRPHISHHGVTVARRFCSASGPGSNPGGGSNFLRAGSLARLFGVSAEIAYICLAWLARRGEKRVYLRACQAPSVR